MKNHIVLGVFILLALSVVVIAARPDFVLADVNPSAGNARVVIPQHAVEVTPGVFSLGTAVHEGKVVQGYAIVRYKDGFGKPSGCNNDGKCQGWEDSSCGDCSDGSTTTSRCYAFLSKGAKWRTLEPYVVNPSNGVGLSENFVVNNFALDVGKWETAASFDIIGTGSATNDALEADLVTPDNRNEVYFADVEDNNAIAITIVWGIFGGPPSQRELVEWDQVYDDVDFDWSSSGEAGKMDFENIATHELGHSVGLSDLYKSGCTEETMYGYANNGETQKRTLEAGDIAGVQELYG